MNWLKIVAILAILVIYLLGWALLATVFLFLLGMTPTWDNILTICAIGSIMTLGRDWLIRPIAERIRILLLEPKETNE